jgi:uroporphyrinogen decarboxylase
MFKAVIDRIVDFYLVANEIFYEATKGLLSAVLIGNDFGSQQNLMLSPALIRDLVFPGTKRLIDQAHSYGLKVIHHSCGSIYDIIPDLIELGADAIHPIQALAHNMEADRLAREFGGRASFCGGVDAQNLLVHGNPADISAEVGAWSVSPDGPHREPEPRGHPRGHSPRERGGHLHRRPRFIAVSPGPLRRASAAAGGCIQ